MPGLKTEITEIATGLGMLGVGLGDALASPPSEFVNVDDATWSRLDGAFRSGSHAALFTHAWANGRAFLTASDGLRRRLPRRVEWKGPDRQVEADPIPADLRIDHVYLVSIKTRSDVLANRSPARLFLGRPATGNWFLLTAPDEYRALYRAVVAYVEEAAPMAGAAGAAGVAGVAGAAGTAARPVTGDGCSAELAGHGPGLPGLTPDTPPTGAAYPTGSTCRYPDDVAELTAADGKALGRLLPGRSWPASLHSRYLDLVRAVSAESARRWNEALVSAADREQQAWRLLRLAPAPYFVLGTSSAGPLRIRVDTPWDWRRTWEFVALDVRPAVAAGQPQVDWTLRARERSTGIERVTEGYVEVRWSHGRFSGAPEAKVQLRSRHEDVPGYTPLT